MRPILKALGKLSWGKRAYAVFLLCATTAIALPAQTFTTLHSFDYTDGQYPYAGLVQATDGSLYGTTTTGGASGSGTVFKITPAGKLTMLHSFDNTDGANPFAGLVQATDGNFYGTTYYGGAYGYGTVFKITSAGKLTMLHSFDNTDGANPMAGLVQATDGNFYGTTEDGGASGACAAGCGTVFKITPAGEVTTLHSFDSTDGAYPFAGLVQATDGDFYGTTQNGGAHDVPPCASGGAVGCGMIFKITPGGTLTTLHSFDLTDGAGPEAGLVQATDGNFYGTTVGGGDLSCILTPGFGCGTVFEITPAGKLTTLHSFCSQIECIDGSYPTAALVQATDGNFYGTTGGGGSLVWPVAIFGCGAVFRITLKGSLETLYAFDGVTDGYFPIAGLVQATDGNLYGTTGEGGPADGDVGTIFSLAVGLGPFVETEPTSGKVGTPVRILGTNLADVSCVMFNGRAAAFTVVSSSEIKTTVPKDATTGKVKVTTPHGTLSSNVPFRVLP
jgi:uncharacterized repeat protein (TIGR03803 family)